MCVRSLRRPRLLGLCCRVPNGQAHGRGCRRRDSISRPATRRRVAEQILAVDASWIDSAIFPPHPLWVVACVFHWTDDDRAADFYESAWKLAQALAQTIADPQLHASFKRLPFYTAMAAIDGANGWPTLPAAASERLRNGNPLRSKHGSSPRRTRVSRSDVARD
jgi:hypothetical protein